MPIGKRLSALLAGALCALPATAQTAMDKAPQRVVSMNLCTDQLAMLLAAPGQLYAVSYIARDSRASAMVAQAQAYKVTHGLAEEIYLMQPDLVIAGAFSTRATTDMLRRLGIPVVVFEPAYGLSDVRDRIAQMGAVLHREAQADAMIAAFDARLATLGAAAPEPPRAVLYSANGYTSGPQTLAGEILAAAGFDNAADRDASGRMQLEVLALANPDVVVTSRPYPGGSRAEEILDHPVVRHLRTERAGAVMTDADWVCGTPYVLRAIEDLAQVRRRLTGDAP